MASFTNASTSLLKRGRSPCRETVLEAHSGERINVTRDEPSDDPPPSKKLRIDGDSDDGSVSIDDDIDDADDSFLDAV